MDLPALAADYGLRERLTWIRGATDGQLAALYAGAALTVSCSLYEGFNLPLLESISAGTPVLVSDLPVHREVAGDAGAFAALEGKAMAEALGELLAAPSALQALAQACPRVAAAYTWEASAARMATLLKGDS